MTDYILTETSDPLITVLSGDTVTLAEGESYLGEVFGVTNGSAPVSVHRWQRHQSRHHPACRNRKHGRFLVRRDLSLLPRRSCP